ncbi:hypothetical protein FLX27_04615 [Agrobacterium tumefaciens]|nr:hypothetical protein FLX27_04615 [Agrobacterium tumefaciens]
MQIISQSVCRSRPAESLSGELAQDGMCFPIHAAASCQGPGREQANISIITGRRSNGSPKRRVV